MKSRRHGFNTFLIFQFLRCALTAGLVCSGEREPLKCCVNHYEVDGTCLECPAGWLGFNCSVPCTDDYYGRFCVNVCNCSSEYQCHPVNGCILLSSDESHMNHHFTRSVPEQNQKISIQNSQTYMDINDTNSMRNVNIKNDSIDMQINHAMIPEEDSISGSYVEESHFNTNHHSPAKRKFSSFKAYVKNYDTSDIHADIEEKYTACQLNGITSPITDSPYFTEEDNAYFVLESQDKACEDNAENTMSVDNLPPPRFSVLGEW